MYIKSIVSYIEILGFDDMIINSNIGDALHALELIEFLCDYTGSSSDFSNKPNEDINHTSISGCIVRTIDFNLGDIDDEIFSVGLLQARLTLHGYIIKGCLSVGNLYISESEIFGPALSEAKNLDTNLAFFPRILISDKVTFSSEYIKVDHDGLLFLDYLSIYASLETYSNSDIEPDNGAINEDEDNDANLYTLLSSHKDLIRKTLEQATNKYDTCSQYLWLKNYHNSFVKDCIDITEEEKSELHYS